MCLWKKLSSGIFLIVLHHWSKIISIHFLKMSFRTYQLTFIVYVGSRKKLAKHAAATAALAKLLGDAGLKSGLQVSSPYKKQNITNLQQQLADHIGR